MKLDRAGSVAVVLAVIFAGAPAWAGGASFGDDDTNPGGDSLSLFGFVRLVDGPGLADAKVTAAFKNGNAVVTRTDILGLYKFPALGSGIDPDDVTISCAKDGYKQAQLERRPRGDAKDPVETECYMQKQ